MQWGVAGRLGVALRLLERCSWVGIAAHDLGTAVAQRTLVISLEGATRGRLKPHLNEMKYEIIHQIAKERRQKTPS